MTNDTSSEIIGRSPETTWKAVKVVAKKWGVFEGKARESQRRKAWLWKHPNDRLGEEEGGRWGKGSRRGVSPGFLNLCPASPSSPPWQPLPYNLSACFVILPRFLILCVRPAGAVSPPSPMQTHSITYQQFTFPPPTPPPPPPPSQLTPPLPPTSSAPPHSFDSCCFWPKEKTTVYILLSFLCTIITLGILCFI